MKYQELTYRVQGQNNISYETALRCWKTQHKTFDVFKREVITHAAMLYFADHVQELWDDIQPLTIKEAFEQSNIEMRRLFFSCIGIEEMFKQMEPELINIQTVAFKNKRWDANNNMYIKKITDVYELYKIRGDKLFPDETTAWRRENADTYAVRCWCTTTDREYWIYVPKWVGDMEDAIEAIAWTMMINITDPEYIVRQGDIVIAKASEKSRKLHSARHLNKSEYLTLLQSQT